MAEATPYSDKGQPSRITIGNDPIEKLLRYDGTATSLHAKTLSRLMARRKLSERAISRHYDAWGRTDDHCRLHIDLTRKAKNADGTQGDKREMPWARSVVVPMSYAILQVIMTQQMGIFTGRDPIIEIQGVGPDDVRAAQLMNAVIEYDQVQTNYPVHLYSAIQDAFKYGMGGLHDCWEDENGYKTVRAKPAIAKVLSMLGLRTSRRKWDKLRSYNKVEAWDPYNFFPDPRVSLSDLQKGEFIGHRVWRGYLEILANDLKNGGNYFNCEQVKHASPKAQALRSRNRYQTQQMNLIGSADEKDNGFHAIDSFVVSIIPREWELGSGDRPEKWQFAWADDQVIIRAHRADYDHGQFNYSAFESNIDPHVFGNPGSIGNLDGLQRWMNWCYNSHIQNVIRFLNNRMIYASSMIETFDVENPDAAMNIRLTAIGEEMVRSGKMTIQQMIHQMVLTDVTTPLVQLVNQMFDFGMRMVGAADQMMGRTTQEKRTLGEVARVGHEGSARMAMHAGMIDAQGIRPLALRWCSNRQQYTSDEMYVRITGRATAVLGQRHLVRPQDLYGNYDYIARTGPIGMEKGDRAKTLVAAAEMLFKQQGILGMPNREGKFLDPHEFIEEILRDSEIKDVDEFYRLPPDQQGAPGQQMPPPGMQQNNVKVLPDDQVEKMRDQGNIVPMREAA